MRWQALPPIACSHACRLRIRYAAPPAAYGGRRQMPRLYSSSKNGRRERRRAREGMARVANATVLPRGTRRVCQHMLSLCVTYRAAARLRVGRSPAPLFFLFSSSSSLLPAA